MTVFGRIDSEVRQAPDLVGAAIISTAGAVVAQDWPGATASGLASTSPRYVEFDSNVAIAINMYSTGAAVPSTNSSGSTAATALSIMQQAGHQHVYRIPATSTGYSVTGPTSGAVSIHFWSAG